jgi:transposase InsO family protein
MSLQTVSLIELAWELFQCKQSPDQIAIKINKDRATVYRWLAGIKLCGIRRFLHKYKQAKKGRRQKRKTDPIIKARIYAIREKYHHCCGEKIQYWMNHDYGVKISVTTIYEILSEKYQLRSKYRLGNQKRGPVPTADAPRKVIQSDTVDFGGLFAYTAIDIFGRDAQVIMSTGIEARDGARALKQQMKYFQFCDLLQRDGGSEFEKVWEQTAKRYSNKIRTARPYRKNEQAYIESFNRTLRKECLGWRHYKRKDLKLVQQKVNRFLEFYNHTRPHLSLNLMSPNQYLSHLRV